LQGLRLWRLRRLRLRRLLSVLVVWRLPAGMMPCKISPRFDAALCFHRLGESRWACDATDMESSLQATVEGGQRIEKR
jgi:hypothetical protein